MSDTLEIMLVVTARNKCVALHVFSGCCPQSRARRDRYVTNPQDPLSLWGKWRGATAELRPSLVQVAASVWKAASGPPEVCGQRMLPQRHPFGEVYYTLVDCLGA